MAIVKEFSNSVNITPSRSRNEIVYVAQQPGGRWHWHRSKPGCTFRSKESFATEWEALEAAATVALTSNARLKVTPPQKQYVIFHWMDTGARAFYAGLPVENLIGAYVKRGWWQAAAAECQRQEADENPHLEAAEYAPTLAEAYELQASLS